MQVVIWQVIIITLLAFIYRVDRYGTQVNNYNAVLYAWLVGLILGDGLTGLEIGAAVQLMSLGVAALAGSSVPDYPLAAMTGTAVTIITGQDQGVGLAVGVAVGMLGVQLDVVAKVLNGFMARKQSAYAQAGEYDKMKRITFLGLLFFGLTDAIPMFVVLLFGADAVNAILSVVPAWFTSGLSIAGGMLPVIGMAALISYMPVKQYFSFLAIGFALSAYFGVGILPIAIIGSAAAYEVYKRLTSSSAGAAAAIEGGLEDE
ncbi:PTS mannose/fructose/sorbose/N-acetylgalactosamine transporter subunit IIC [Lancefieldella rimae]|uniref:PTS mannose/fructose/sorbose/N-acetylgalactosamine transporter subunit IIC n=1 Tax=Lancefieldella rimae TaxID=1383 RepID=UPI003A8CAA11